MFIVDSLEKLLNKIKDVIKAINNALKNVMKANNNVLKSSITNIRYVEVLKLQFQGLVITVTKPKVYFLQKLLDNI